MKKAYHWFPRLLVALLLAFFLLWVTDSLYVLKAVRYNLVNIDDYKLFPNRVIPPSSKPQPWPLAKAYNKASATQELEKIHQEYQSISYLVLKNGEILHERYWEGYGDSSLVNSFSMAKSFVGASIGIALKQGKIKALNDPIGDYIEEFEDTPLGNTPILHFLMMSSGSSWDESYINPFSMTTKAYYGKDLEKLILGLEKEENSAQVWKYKSGDTQVLALVLERATGLKLADFVAKYLWEPMGAENKALWSLDQKNGTEKAYCCLNSNARDFARFGHLYNHKGNWKGQQLVPANYVNNSLLPNRLKNENGKTVDWYGWQWWLHPPVEGHAIHYCRGILGQYIICVPDLDLVVVRLGKKRASKAEGSEHPADVAEYVKGALEISKATKE